MYVMIKQIEKIVILCHNRLSVGLLFNRGVFYLVNHLQGKIVAVQTNFFVVLRRKHEAHFNPGSGTCRCSRHVL